MRKSSMTMLAAAFLVAAMLLAPGAGAVSCQVTELSPCLPAMTTPAPPTDACCKKLQDQQPCLCGYMKDPALRAYLSSPNAKKVADVCHIPFPPKC